MVSEESSQASNAGFLLNSYRARLVLNIDTSPNPNLGCLEQRAKNLVYRVWSKKRHKTKISTNSPRLH